MNEEEKKVIEDMSGDWHRPEAEQETYNQKAFSDTVREYIQKGNVTKIIVRRGENVILNLPLNAGIVGGIIGAVAAPWAVIATAVAAVGFDCSVELVKDNGEIVDLSPRKTLHGLGDALRDAGGDIADEFRGAGFSGAGQDAPVDEEIPFEDSDNAE